MQLQLATNLVVKIICFHELFMYFCLTITHLYYDETHNKGNMELLC